MPTEIIGQIDSDGGWYAYGDAFMTFDPIEETPAQLPATATVDRFVLTYTMIGWDGEQKVQQLVNVGRDGNDLYIQNPITGNPDSWIKGTVDGDKAVFANQYVGTWSMFNLNCWTKSATFVNVVDSTYGYPEYDRTYEYKDELVFDYDAEAMSLACAPNEAMVIMGDTVSFFMADMGGMDLKRFADVAAKPATPEISYYSAYNPQWGSGFVSLTIPQVDTDGKLFAGAFQSYMVGSDNSIQQKWGCKGYLMGTDELGRDIFTRIVHGGKKTMTIGAVAVIISAVIAIIVGCLSGYFGGWVDMLLMRVTEVFGAIPFLPFALILSAILAGTNISEDTRIFMIMVILGLLSWTGLARMIRGQVLAEREKEFVIAAKAMGVKESRIAFKHILPNVISVILVSLTLDFAGCMLTESSLSYLGFGVKLPQPTWGNMLNGCNNELVIGTFWWRWLFPALFLLITTICINIVGDSLRDVLDPKSDADR